MNGKRWSGFLVLPAVFLLLVGCGSPAADPETIRGADASGNPSNATPEGAQAPVPAAAETPGPVTIDNPDGPPFYARFGENEYFSDGEWVVVVFYRPPDCIPADFNLVQFFHFPDDGSPGAFGCAPPVTSNIETWATGPGLDPAPFRVELSGLGAVPVWFFSVEDVDAAMEDGVVTIAELAGLPSRLVGTAAEYAELLHPSQSNAAPLIRFTASGTLEDGGSFSVDVSSGDPGVEDHVDLVIDG